MNLGVLEYWNLVDVKVAATVSETRTRKLNLNRDRDASLSRDHSPSLMDTMDAMDAMDAMDVRARQGLPGRSSRLRGLIVPLPAMTSYHKLAKGGTDA